MSVAASPPSEGTPPKITSPLAVASFRALWLAATVSFIGSFVQDVAERWLILDLTKSPLPSALIQTVFVSASLVMMLPAGILADRHDRRLLVAISQATQAAVACGVGLLVLSGHVTPALLLCGAALLGLGMAFASPAWNALIPDLVPRELVPDAVAINAVAFNIARAIGPAIGGVVLSTAGSAAAFLLNAATFIAVLVTVMRFCPKGPTPTPAPLRTAFREPLALVMHDIGMRSIFVAMTGFSLGASMVYALTPAFGKTTLGASASAYGIMIGAMGLGAVIGAPALKRFRAWKEPRVVVAINVLAFSLSALLLASAKSVPLACAILVPAGVGWTGAFSSCSALAQLWTPDRLRARLLALYGMIHLGTWAIGSSIGGVLAARYDVRTAMTAGAIVGTASGLLTLTLRLPSKFVAPAS